MVESIDSARLVVSSFYSKLEKREAEVELLKSKIGKRVKSKMSGMLGSVVDANDLGIEVRWDIGMDNREWKYLKEIIEID